VSKFFKKSKLVREFILTLIFCKFRQLAMVKSLILHSLATKDFNFGKLLRVTSGRKFQGQEPILPT